MKSYINTCNFIHEIRGSAPLAPPWHVSLYSSLFSKKLVGGKDLSEEVFDFLLVRLKQ
jgi:hypothetical protein